MNNILPQEVSENDPSVQVRTDLWGSMTMIQLTKQRDMMVNHISRLQSIMGGNANPTILNMYSALQLGLEDLNQIIDNKYASKGV